RITVLSLTGASRYRNRTASTNSLRVAMLTRLATSFRSRRPLRRVANYVRQQVSAGSRTAESMRAAKIVDGGQEFKDRPVDPTPRHCRPTREGRRKDAR